MQCQCHHGSFQQSIDSIQYVREARITGQARPTPIPCEYKPSLMHCQLFLANKLTAGTMLRFFSRHVCWCFAAEERQDVFKTEAACQSYGIF